MVEFRLMSSAPSLSIIIVSWNGRDLVERCLASVSAHVRTPHEVIVVDNHSTDGTPDIVAAKFPAVQLIRNTTNRGFSAANNQGIATAHGEFLAFLNSDTEVLDDPFPVLLAELKQRGVGAVGPRLLNPDQTFQPSTRRFPRWADQVMTLLKLRHLFRSTPIMQRYRDSTWQTATGPSPVEEIMGAAVIIRRSTMVELGGWDPGYWIWFEDVDLCQRLHQRGERVVFVPTARIIHSGGSSFGQVLSLKKQFWFMRSLWRYAWKYWSPVAAGSLWLFFPISYLLTVIQTSIKPR